jgi:transcriptional regulator with XRE-family HTH domain
MLKSMDGVMPAAGNLPLYRIRERRKALGLSQDDLAELAGCLQTQISRYENNEALPQSDALRALAKALGVSADWLLGLSDVPVPALRESDLTDLEQAAVNALRASAPGQRQRIVGILEEIARISAGP